MPNLSSSWSAFIMMMSIRHIMLQRVAEMVLLTLILQLVFINQAKLANICSTVVGMHDLASIILTMSVITKASLHTNLLRILFFNASEMVPANHFTLAPTVLIQ